MDAGRTAAEHEPQRSAAGERQATARAQRIDRVGADALPRPVGARGSQAVRAGGRAPPRGLRSTRAGKAMTDADVAVAETVV
jgi:hypothetical protein